MSILTCVVLLACASLGHAWFPGVDKQLLSRDGRDLFNTTADQRRWAYSTASGKIRGVNLGSLFVVEPWMASDAWSNMGCEGKNSEFDCVMALGQETANSAFAEHWSTWINETDFAEMASYGLNTVRIPVGYWMMPGLTYNNSEYFPENGFQYLENICDWAGNQGFYIILDLHGAPGAQVSENAFTGQYASDPGFYESFQYERALTFLSWMTNQTHTNTKLRNVGALEILNEPVQTASQAPDLLSSYYPSAVSTIRTAETALNVTTSNRLNVMMMSQSWGLGNPVTDIASKFVTTGLAFDDHRYLKWDSSVPVTPASYLETSCNDDRGPASASNPTIVGEFSLSPPDDVQDSADWSVSGNLDFYQKWFAAQAMAYEKSNGWVFWSWKAELGDARWNYRDAVAAGIVPKDLDSVYSMGAC